MAKKKTPRPFDATGFANLEQEVDKKAPLQALRQAVARIAAVEVTSATKADQKDLEALTDLTTDAFSDVGKRIDGVQATLKGKADTAAVNAALADKADTSAMNAALGMKADASTVNSLNNRINGCEGAGRKTRNGGIIAAVLGLAALLLIGWILWSMSGTHSAHMAGIQEQIATKADKSALSGLATKDELAAATSGLATKADVTAATSGLATKAQVANLETRTGALENGYTALASDIRRKADKAEVTARMDAHAAAIRRLQSNGPVHFKTVKVTTSAGTMEWSN